jgi:hypothetical protein
MEQESMILAYAVAAGFWFLSSILAWHFGYKAGREDERFRASILIRESRRLMPGAGKLLGDKPTGCPAASDAAHAAKELNRAMILAKSSVAMSTQARSGDEQRWVLMRPVRWTFSKAAV